VEFDLSEEQSLLLEALSSIVGHIGEPERCASYYISDPALECRLIDAEFFSLSQNGYSLLDAALIAIQLCRMPVCIEAATSLLVGPLLPASAARPIALAHGDALKVPERPVRFLRDARSLVLVSDVEVHLLELGPQDTRPCNTHYAYPYGFLPYGALERAQAIDVAPEEIRHRHRLAIAAEITGAAQSALARTVQQVKERHQFGRAIGSFQAVQHRLAMAAASVEACRMLTLRAAHTAAPADIAAAAGYAQGLARQLTFDLHQFSGAMGLTLEYPLHLWTYRIRALQGELGSSERQLTAASNLSWGSAKGGGAC
jgi:Acyl-CoA dehydrogenase, C-terminal domain